ncbi:MAG: acyl-CoA thioesterase [Bacteroidia bacterium]|nr:acyl-CoA thioesterase [Bacteroidia bacterium]MBP9688533.1 acyl-CoA thioesterase [Bacteroidia bacterium]
MYIAETKLRVRYGETDQMGVVYHGNYALYFEIARTESLRQIDVTYRGLEESGIMMPVVNLNINFKKPAKYDDLLTIKAIFKTMPTVKTIVDYEIYNELNELLCTGQTTLVFVNMKTNKVTMCPEYLLAKFVPYFN